MEQQENTRQEKNSIAEQENDKKINISLIQQLQLTDSVEEIRHNLNSLCDKLKKGDISEETGKQIQNLIKILGEKELFSYEKLKEACCYGLAICINSHGRNSIIDLLQFPKNTPSNSSDKHEDNLPNFIKFLRKNFPNVDISILCSDEKVLQAVRGYLYDKIKDTRTEKSFDAYVKKLEECINFLSKHDKNFIENELFLDKEIIEACEKRINQYIDYGYPDSATGFIQFISRHCSNFDKDNLFLAEYEGEKKIYYSARLGLKSCFEYGVDIDNAEKIIQFLRENFKDFDEDHFFNHGNNYWEINEAAYKVILDSVRNLKDLSNAKKIVQFFRDNNKNFDEEHFFYNIDPEIASAARKGLRMCFDDLTDSNINSASNIIQYLKENLIDFDEYCSRSILNEAIDNANNRLSNCIEHNDLRTPEKIIKFMRENFKDFDIKNLYDEATNGARCCLRDSINWGKIYNAENTIKFMKENFKDLKMKDLFSEFILGIVKDNLYKSLKNNLSYAENIIKLMKENFKEFDYSAIHIIIWRLSMHVNDHYHAKMIFELLLNHFDNFSKIYNLDEYKNDGSERDLRETAKGYLIDCFKSGEINEVEKCIKFMRKNFKDFDEKNLLSGGDILEAAKTGLSHCYDTNDINKAESIIKFLRGKIKDYDKIVMEVIGERVNYHSNGIAFYEGLIDFIK